MIVSSPNGVFILLALVNRSWTHAALFRSAMPTLTRPGPDDGTLTVVLSLSGLPPDETSDVYCDAMDDGTTRGSERDTN